jgi:tetratricopeptide (TPR) repeat protein/cold shock CspA family protein
METRDLPTGSTSNRTARTRAEGLRKAGDFEQAAAAYAALWSGADLWTGYWYAHCLRKAGLAKDAYAVAKEVYARNPQFKPGRSICAWTLYDVYIRPAASPDPQVLKAAEGIVRLTAGDNAYAPTSPLTMSVLRVAKLWAAKPRDLSALQWLDKLDPARLPTEPRKGGIDEKGQPRELASFREDYYSIRSRSLARLGRWEECLQAATKGLSDCGQLHYGNDVWFARRIALAKQKLGQAPEALAELQRLLPRKPAGFMHTNVAAAAWECGDAALTFKHCLLALLAPDDIGFKLDAALLLAHVLWQRGETAPARTHLSLCLAVRESREWKTSNDVMKLASDWDVSGPRRDPEDLLRELRPLWKRWSEELNPRQTGVIQQVFSHGGAGFIRPTNGGEDLYFNTRDWREHRSKPAAGTHVSFVTKPSFNHKQNRQTIVACEIRPMPVHA